MGFKGSFKGFLFEVPLTGTIVGLRVPINPTLNLN